MTGRTCLGRFCSTGYHSEKQRRRPPCKCDECTSLLNKGPANWLISMAGSDTTVTALRATVLYIITNPLIYTRLKRELKTAQADSKISLPVVCDAEAQNLPYLLACIRESLRLWPPSFGLMQKVVPAEGDTIHGKFVPGGTRIGHCTWGVLRHKQVFGEDSHLYRPERWLEASEEKLIDMVRSADLLFGSGRYACLGKTVAFIELRKCLATVRSLSMPPLTLVIRTLLTA